MPQLPTTLGAYAVPTPQRTTQGYDPSPVARSAEDMAAAVTGLGVAVGQSADAVQAKEDKDAILAAQGKENTAQQAAMKYLYDPTDGILNQTGAAALGATQKAQAYLQQLRNTSMADVTNKKAQIALNNSFNSINNSVMETVMRHESQQRKGYAGDLAAQSGDNARNAVGLQPNDDKLFASSVKQATAAAAAREKIDGKPPGFYAKDAVSDLTKTRVESLLNSSDPNAVVQGGQVYNQAMKDGTLNFAAQVDLGHTLKPILNKAQAQVEFQKDYTATSAGSVPVDNLIHAMKMQESGAQQANAAGAVITSPKGATGIMQVMPDTGPDAAKLAGVAWDEKLFRDPGPAGAAYNETLGRAYMGAQLQKYGDPRLALAAYNMGPGYVDDLMAGTDKSGKNPKMVKTGPDFDAFIAAAPAETQKYVAAVIGSAASASGPPVIDLAKAQAKAAGMPQAVADNYLSMVTAHNEQITAAQKQQQNDVLAKIQPLLEASNGNISAIPPALLAQASKAGVLDKVQAYKGFTDEAFKNHLDMLDTDAFSGIDLSDPGVRLRLSSSDYNAYVKKQADMVNNPSDAAMSRRVDSAVNYVFQSRLSAEVKGKNLVADGDAEGKTTPDDVALQNKVLRFKALVRAQIQDEYARTNKVPGSPDVFKIADSIITSEVSVPGKGWFGMAANASPADVTLDDIPQAARAAIEAARTGRNLPVTEAGVLSDYLMILKQRQKNGG